MPEVGRVTLFFCDAHDFQQGELFLSARHKLNVATVNGAIVIASIVGWATGSPLAFLLTGGVLIAMAIHAGDIRPRRKR
jgi:hypothetical protein